MVAFSRLLLTTGLLLPGLAAAAQAETPYNTTSKSFAFERQRNSSLTRRSISLYPAPQKLGILVFPGFEPIDIFGPSEAFLELSRKVHLDLYMITNGATLDPVSTAPPSTLFPMLFRTGGSRFPPAS